jgi:hypothetical protein
LNWFWRCYQVLLWNSIIPWLANENLTVVESLSVGLCTGDQLSQDSYFHILRIDPNPVKNFGITKLCCLFNAQTKAGF